MAKDPLDDMTSKDLKGLMTKIEDLIVQRQKEQRAALLDEMRARAADAGLNIEDIFGGGAKSKRGSAAVAVKYRNPDNPAETWSGRGRMPRWLAAKVAKRGVTKDQFAV